MPEFPKRIIFAEPFSFKVERNGFVESVKLSWNVPQLKEMKVASAKQLAGLESDGWVALETLQDGKSLIGYDGGYIRSAGMTVTKRQASVDTILSGHGGKLLAAADVPKRLVENVEYGTAAEFAIELPLEFRDVLVRSGTSPESLSFNLQYTASQMYRQPDDTESWGSPNQKILYWYWQDTR